MADSAQEHSNVSDNLSQAPATEETGLHAQYVAMIASAADTTTPVDGAKSHSSLRSDSLPELTIDLPKDTAAVEAGTTSGKQWEGHRFPPADPEPCIPNGFRHGPPDKDKPYVLDPGHSFVVANPENGSRKPLCKY